MACPGGIVTREPAQYGKSHLNSPGEPLDANFLQLADWCLLAVTASFIIVPLENIRYETRYHSQLDADSDGSAAGLWPNGLQSCALANRLLFKPLH